MRVLLLTNEFPLPQNAGGVRRQLGLSEGLSRRHQLHLLAREREPTPPALIDELRDRLGSPVETFPAIEQPDRSPAALARRWGRSVARHRPPWMLPDTGAIALANRAAELAPRFDVAVTLDDIAHGYIEPLHPLIPIVLDKHNVQGASAALNRPWGTGVRGRALRRLTLGQIRAFERMTCRLAAAVVVTCEEEADRFTALYGWRPEVVLSAVAIPDQIADPAGADGVVVWLGDGLYAPNTDGLVRFAREAWTPLGTDGAVLLVAGRQQPADVRGLEELPGIRVLGFVDDIQQLLSRSAAGIVPLWAGAAIKNKTLTMMASGLPLVGTPVGFEGIAVRDQVEAIVAEDSSGLADGIRRLLRDRPAAAAMGRRGRQRIVQDHSWDVLIDHFERVLEAAAARRS